MKKIFILHSDRYDEGYTDDVIYAYSTYEWAVKKLNKLWNEFILTNKIQEWIKKNEEDTKRRASDNWDLRFDMWIEEIPLNKQERWRPTKDKQERWVNKVDPYSLSQQIINIKPWQYYYTRAEDKTVSWILATNKMSWQWFKTERVIVVHLKTWETERWVLVSRDEAKSYSKITKETADRNFRDRSKWKYVARTQWYYEYNGKYIAIDNRTNDFFMEEFDTKEECFNYLNE